MWICLVLALFILVGAVSSLRCVGGGACGLLSSSRVGRGGGLRLRPLYDSETAVSEGASASSKGLALTPQRQQEQKETGLSKSEDDEELLSLSRGGTAQLKTLMEKMPLEEKYSLLLQSYASSVMERSADDSAKVLKTMESLYTEMLCLSIKPGEKSARSMLNAAATFCNSEKLAEVMQLVKAGGYVRAFGVINAQLTKPLMSAAVESKAMLSESIQVPKDDREAEVLYASIVAGTASVYLSLQLVGHTVATDVAPWATLFGLLAVLSGVADVGLRKGKGLKLAAAGVDRLVLNDAEREYHSESAAFLSAYMLGLPCFCFQPEVSEAVKMLRDAPGSLSAYKQPRARFRPTPKSSETSTQNSGFFGLNMNLGGGGSSKNKKENSGSSGSVGGEGVMANIMKSTSLALRREEVEETYQVSREAVKESLIDTESIQSADVAGLGRVLVWIMSPVAAEVQRYGKTVVSDPRRGKRLLDVLEAIQGAENKDISGASEADRELAQEIEAALPHIEVPAKEEDKDALLRWAYFEADTLLKQYGDLVVDVGDYLGSGSSSVGEVVALLEQELL